MINLNRTIAMIITAMLLAQLATGCGMSDASAKYDNTLLTDNTYYREFVGNSSQRRALLDIFSSKCFVDGNTLHYPVVYDNMVTDYYEEYSNIVSNSFDSSEVDNYVSTVLVSIIRGSTEFESIVIGDSFTEQVTTVCRDQLNKLKEKLDTPVHNSDLNKCDYLDLGYNKVIAFGGSGAKCILNIKRIVTGDDAVKELQSIDSRNSGMVVDGNYKLIYIDYTVENISSSKIKINGDNFIYYDGSLYEMSGDKVYIQNETGIVDTSSAGTFSKVLIAPNNAKNIYWIDKLSNTSLKISLNRTAAEN